MKRKKTEKLSYFENDSYLEPKDWQKQIRWEIQHFRQTYSKNTTKDNSVINELLDYSPAMEKRRTAALLDSLKKLDENRRRYAGDWISLNILIAGYSSLEFDGHILKAASIWILDRLTEYNVAWTEVYPLLPKDDELLDDFFPVDIWDCCYNENLIASVEYVLSYRNKDIAPLESDGDGGYRIITSELAAGGKDHADVLSRRNFESLLALLPQSVKDDAVRHFENCFQVWTDCFFPGIAYLHDKAVEKIEDLNKIRREMNELQDKIEKKMNQYAASKSRIKKEMQKLTPKPPVNVLLRNPVQPDNIIYMPTAPTGVFSTNPMESLAAADVEIEKLIDRLEVLEGLHDKVVKDFEDAAYKRSIFLYTISRNGYLCADMAEEYFPSEVRDVILKPLTFTDPYELCFALLYLVETGSDLPWLYGACSGMMKEVIDSLPWGMSDYDAFDDPYWEVIPPISNKKPDFPDWYKREYSCKGDDEYEVRNLAQIVFETTGCLMPRDLHRYDAELRMLGKYGIKQNKAIAVLYCMLALSSSRRQRHANNLEPNYMKWLLSESDEEAPPLMDWAEQKADLEKQIQQLRSELHTAEKAAADARKQMEKQRLTAEAEHRELADLREIVFNNDDFDRVDDSTVEIADDKKYPYTIQKSTVVFGGHETWLKSLKPMLKGDVKFVAKEMKIDVSLIRYADVIWVQSNAIPHRSYYSIVNTARKLGKPIRYFTNASAVKCAEQIVENDKR